MTNEIKKSAQMTKLFMATRKANKAYVECIMREDHTAEEEASCLEYCRLLMDDIKDHDLCTEYACWCEMIHFQETMGSKAE